MEETYRLTFLGHPVGIRTDTAIK